MKKKKLEQMQDKYPHFSKALEPGTDEYKAVNAKIAEVMDGDIRNEKASFTKSGPIEYIQTNHEVESFFKAMDEGTIHVSPFGDLPYTTTSAVPEVDSPEPKVDKTVSYFEMALKNMQDLKAKGYVEPSFNSYSYGFNNYEPKVYAAGVDPYTASKKLFKSALQPGEGAAFDPNKAQAVAAAIHPIAEPVPVVKAGYLTKANALKINQQLKGMAPAPKEVLPINEDEEIIFNLTEVAEHYAMEEFQRLYGDLNETNTEKYKEILGKHTEAISSFKRTNNE